MRNLLVTLLLMFSWNIIAQPSATLDPTFGTAGKVTTSISSGQDKAYGVSIQSDGKIIVAGYSTSTITGKDFSVARYNSNGTLDNDFGNNGIVTIDLQTGSEDIAYSVALQTDGKIVLAGSSDNGTNQDAALVRINSDGTLDNSFGNNGIVLTDFDGLLQDDIKVVKIHPLSGKIIVGGSSVISTYVGKPVVARYLSDGSLDNTFNENGIKTLWIRSSDNTKRFSVEDLIVESNGKISATGWQRSLTPGIHNEYWACRIDASGEMDLTFSQDGVVNFSHGSTIITGLLLNSDHDLILVGSSYYIEESYLRTLRIFENGNLDGTPNNYAGYNYSGYHKASKIVEDVNGKYVMVGASGSSESSQSFLIGRLNQNLSIDNAFITTGFTTVSFGNNLNEAFAVAIQADNKIVAVGYSGNNFAIARLIGDAIPNLDNCQLLAPANLSSFHNFSNLAFDWTDAFGASTYQIEFDLTSDFNSPQTFATTTSNFSHSNLLPNTQYYWRVKASDGTNWGSYSTTWSFKTNSLENFNLLSPPNNSANQNYTGLSFDWTNNIGATSYQLFIDTTSSFTTNPLSITVSNSNYTASLLPDKEYYWKVRAGNGTIWGDWSPIWEFRTKVDPSISVNEVTLSVINIFPNPVKDLITLEVSDVLFNKQFEILDVNGKLMYSGLINNVEVQINVNHFTSGVYFVQIIDYPLQKFKFLKE